MKDGEDFKNLWTEGPDIFDDVPTPTSPKPKGKREQPDRFIGCPLGWFKRAHKAVKSKGELVVALHVYRRSVVCKSREVLIANKALQDEYGVSRKVKSSALRRLTAAGLITYKTRGDGQATLVKILGRKGPK